MAIGWTNPSATTWESKQSGRVIAPALAAMSSQTAAAQAQTLVAIARSASFTIIGLAPA